MGSVRVARDGPASVPRAIPQSPELRAARLASPPDDEAAQVHAGTSRTPRGPGALPLWRPGSRASGRALAAPSDRARVHPCARRPPVPVRLPPFTDRGRRAPPCRCDRRGRGPPALTSRPSEGDWLHAVGHSYRVEIMRRFLATGTATPSDIARALRLPLTTVSYHVHFLADRGIVRLAGRTQRRGAVAHHYQLTDRDRVASIVWGIRAELLVTDFERQNGRGDVTVRLDTEALAELHVLTADYLARVGELGLQTRERRSADDAQWLDLTQVAVLLGLDVGGESINLTGR